MIVPKPEDLLDSGAKARLTDEDRAEADKTSANIAESLAKEWTGGSFSMLVETSDRAMSEVVRCYELAGWLVAVGPYMSPVSVATGNPKPLAGHYVLSLRPRWWRG